jgi:tetratricopeptide (TPR) repeat protein
VRASIYYWQMWSPWDTREATAPEVGANLSMADYRANRDPALEAALRYTPEPIPLAKRIIPLLESGDTTAAIATLRAYRAAPEHQYAVTHTAIDTIAGFFVEKGQLPRAIGAAELWVREHSSESMAYVILGELYGRAGRAADARQALEAAVRVGPSNDYAQERLKALTERR